MKTHTIRNKASTTPILTLAPAFWEHATQACYPESLSLALGWFSAQYRDLTGKDVRLAHEQLSEFLAQVGANEQGLWTSRFVTKPAPVYRAIRLFEDGFLRSRDMDLEQALNIAQTFYAAIEVAHPGP